MSAHPLVVDCDDRPLTIGSRVRVGTEPHVWTITVITDCDGDVDDEGKQYGIPPYVKVALDGERVPDEANEADAETCSFRTYWTAAGWWDEDAPYKTDDLEAVEATDSDDREGWATDAERDAGTFFSGYAPTDPKSDGYHDRMADLYDSREGK